MLATLCRGIPLQDMADEAVAVGEKGLQRCNPAQWLRLPTATEQRICDPASPLKRMERSS
ncbi:hypothetical protein [Mycobacterium sp. AZCC_0083]|uniref:hypothetical protein n=1 Tax=Mycobacterium sp. AZCC_0083 TaxID=2735882 RepID=UPI00161E14EB|nr:hypothetical protein [Mycobacterium sp. AZCC_0083]MBB5165695.1 hypothetical protein [Mycobacterium sp. AZCC_0083]